MQETNTTRRSRYYTVAETTLHWLYSTLYRLAKYYAEVVKKLRETILSNNTMYVSAFRFVWQIGFKVEVWRFQNTIDTKISSYL